MVLRSIAFVFLSLSTFSWSICLAQSQVEPNDSATIEGSFLFPADTSVFAQVDKLGDLVERILEHPLRSRIESLEPVKKGLSSPQYVQAMLGVGLFESQLGTDWLSALKSLTDHGVFVGGNPLRREVGLAVHANDEVLLQKAVSTILTFVKNNDQAAGDSLVIEDYSTGKIATFRNRAVVGRFSDWLLVSNNGDYLKAMANRLAQRSASSLADQTDFQQARELRSSDSDAFVYSAIDELRESGRAERIFQGTTTEPAVELLFGGILEALKSAPWVVGNIHINEAGVSLKASMPFDSETVPEQREFFFGTRGLGRAPRPLELPDVLGQAVIYRDLGNWWLNKENLFPENVVAQLAQGDSQLSTIFGGVDFGAEVLGAVQPGLRLVIKNQEYAEGVDPDVKLPSFALVARLQNPESGRRFRISFQSLMGILNLSEGGMDRPQIELITTQEDGVTISSGTYEPDGGHEGNQMIFNFSPAIAFQDDYMVVSSTRELALEVALATQDLDDQADTTNSNAQIKLDVNQINRILMDNRESLIANTMLQDGLKRSDAEARVDALLSVLEFGRDFNLDYRVDGKLMELDLNLNLQNPRVKMTPLTGGHARC
ncbi:MAG: hypothetical protein R3C03_17200 [Pirellulaceae bacterium]